MAWYWWVLCSIGYVGAASVCGQIIYSLVKRGNMDDMEPAIFFGGLLWPVMRPVTSSSIL